MYRMPFCLLLITSFMLMACTRQSLFIEKVDLSTVNLRVIRNDQVVNEMAFVRFDFASPKLLYDNIDEFPTPQLRVTLTSVVY